MEILLNWLGQGGVVALAAAAMLRATPRSRPQARYSIAWAASVIVLALPVAPRLMVATFPGPPADATVVSLGPVVSMPTAWWTSSALAIGLWIIWCGVSIIRLAAAAVALRNIKRQCRACSPDLQPRLVSWSRVRISGRRTSLVVSTEVRSAAVLGGGAPMIALAPQLVEQLSDEDLDRVVMHEWAHSSAMTMSRRSPS
jgi:beta-lactamase regulating signal transducer with metallopeptidase domain